MREDGENAKPGQSWPIFARSEKIRELASVGFILALVTAMLTPCLRGDCPIGHDHPVHLFRIWQFGQTLRQHWFSPWVWSNRWFAGYPENLVYPVGADFFVLTVRALSLGILNLEHAYGLAFWLFYFLYGYATYYFVRWAVESRIAALIAVVFLLTDPGSNDTGGWFWLVDLGVWTAALGMVPALIGLVQTARFLEDGKPRIAAKLSLCIGLSLLCHPLHLIFFALAIPLLLLSRYLAGEPVSARRTLPLLGTAVVTGGLIASYWLVPYLGAARYAAEIGFRGQTLEKIGGALAGGQFFDRMNFLAAAFGLVGAVCLLFSKKSLQIFMGLFIFTAIAASSTTVADLFGTRISILLGEYVIANRFIMLAKPFWYGAAGILLVNSWRALARWRTENQTNEPPGKARKRQWVLLGVSAVLVGPIAFYFLASFIRSEVRRPTLWYSQRTDLAARKDFIAWARSTLNKPDEFFRIAHGFDANDHDLADLAIDLPYPFYEVTGTPTGHFRYAIDSSSNAAFRAANVRFALCHHPIPTRPDLRLIQVFQERLWLYEFRDWNPVPYEITGTGSAELLAFRDDEILLRAGPGASGVLRLNVSDYPKWEASRDHVPVEITPLTLPGVAHSAFMQVPLSPGLYRFHYQKDFTDYAGTVLSLCGLFSCALLFYSDRFAQKLNPHRDEPPPPAG